MIQGLLLNLTKIIVFTILYIVKKIASFVNFIYDSFKKPETSTLYDFKPPRLQSFFLPYNYMRYIAATTVSSKALDKLQKTCKYFFSKNQILIVDCFEYDGYESLYTIFKKPENSYIQKWLSNYVYFPLRKSHYSILLDELPPNVSFWITKTFRHAFEDVIGRLVLPPKIHSISLRELVLYNTELSKLEFEYLSFSGNLETLFLDSVAINEGNDRKWTWLEIYSTFSNLTAFGYGSFTETTTADTIMKLHAVDHKVQLKCFALDIIIDSIFTDIHYLWNFMEANAAPPRMKHPRFTTVKLSEFEFTFRNSALETHDVREGSRRNETSFDYKISLANR